MKVVPFRKVDFGDGDPTLRKLQSLSRENDGKLWLDQAGLGKCG